MAVLSGFLITVRTAKQGAAMEKGKHTDEYKAETATLTLNPEDYDRLQLKDDNKAIIKSVSGEAIVSCRSADGPEGVFFLPLGPVANSLIGEQTDGTGVPSYKGLQVTVESI